MTFEAAAPAGHPDNELAGLIATLHETQQRIAELTNGAVDAVLHWSGSTYLLEDAQAKLRQSEADQRKFAIERAAILDALPAHIALLDVDGRIIAANQAWRRCAGTYIFPGSNSTLGQNYVDACEDGVRSHGDEVAKVVGGVRSVLNGSNRDFITEYRFHSSAGQHWFRLVVMPLHDDQFGGCVVMHADITEQKVAEDALRSSESRLRAIIENEPECVKTISADGLLVDINPAGLRMFEAEDRAAIVGRPFIQTVHPEDRLAFGDMHKRVCSGGAAQLQFRVLGFRGGERWVESHSTPLRQADGKIAAALSVARDITASKISQERLEQQAALLDEAQDAILVAGIDGLVQYWNRSAERIYGWTVSEALGRSLRDLLYDHLPGREKAIAAIEKALAAVLEDGRWSGQLQQRRKDGTTVTAECTFSVLRDNQGNPRAFLSINTDVTQRVALEEQNRQLQRLESIGQLTGGIAHDFNNLLTIILGNAELLVEDVGGDQQLRPIAETILGAAERGAELIARLLAFARRQPLDPRSTDIAGLISGMQDMLRRTLGAQTTIQMICADRLWNAQVDASQLTNALINLSINARDAMPDGGQLTIETANAEVGDDYADQSAQMAPGQYVMIAVSDNGAGMPPDVLARAFDPFFTTKDVGKGSGLGLSMVFGFIKQSKGHVKIYSEVGQGTSVKLFLPREKSDIDALERPLEDSTIPVGSETILYVEDDEQVRKHVTAQLEWLGYAVVNASNGAEAIDRLRRGDKFDLLFTDVIMPGGMNGRQLADRVREVRPSLAVLFTSGFTEWAIVREGRVDPGTQLLTKPFRVRDLARKVRQVLDSAVPKNLETRVRGELRTGE